MRSFNSFSKHWCSVVVVSFDKWPIYDTKDRWSIQLTHYQYLVDKDISFHETFVLIVFLRFRYFRKHFWFWDLEYTKQYFKSGIFRVRSPFDICMWNAYLMLTKIWLTITLIKCILGTGEFGNRAHINKEKKRKIEKTIGYITCSVG